MLIALRVLSIAIVSSLIAPACQEASAQWHPQAFQPAGKQVKGFGYGQVIQSLVASGSLTGLQICQSITPALSCTSVSGGAQCSSIAPVQSLVTCTTKSQPPVDETAFQPVNCQNQGLGDGGVSGLLGSMDWCLIAGYMPQRMVDTIYQYNDFVRLGVNKRFGGMISELYGPDKVDRIMQNAGGAMQLSLWAFSDGYAPATAQRAYFAVSSTSTPAWKGAYDTTAYASISDCQNAHPGLQCVIGVEGPNLLTTPSVYPCAANGQGAGAPFNPIQAASSTCDWGLPQGAIDGVKSLAPGQITVSKTAPANFSRSDAMQGVVWQQTTQVKGPAAIVSYQMTSSLSIPDNDFQEIPAIFLHQGLGATVFYYGGSKPYADVGGAVSSVDVSKSGTEVLELPLRKGPFGTGAITTLSEDWLSTCDASLTSCLTIASFSASAQDMVASFNSEGSYYGIHGFFSLTNKMNRKVTVIVFPYRFDDVVMGMTIRAWIYMFHGNPLYR